MSTKRYMVRVIVNGLFHGYLMHNDRTRWCYTQARKHGKDLVARKNWNYILEEV